MRQLGAGNSIPVQTEVINTRNALRYGQLTLERILAEIRASASHVGEVILSGGSPTPGGPPVFSATPGRFTVVADAAKILLRGGPMPLVRALEAAGHGARVAPLEASAAELAATMRFGGGVRTVLQVGGKILIVVAVAVDMYELVVAEDHLEAPVISVAGWAVGVGRTSCGDARERRRRILGRRGDDTLRLPACGPIPRSASVFRGTPRYNGIVGRKRHHNGRFHLLLRLTPARGRWFRSSGWPQRPTHPGPATRILFTGGITWQTVRPFDRARPCHPGP